MAQAKLTRSHLDDRENWKRGMATMSERVGEDGGRGDRRSASLKSRSRSAHEWEKSVTCFRPMATQPPTLPAATAALLLVTEGSTWSFPPPCPLHVLFLWFLPVWRAEAEMLHSECSWHADLWWVQIQVCAFFFFVGWRFRQDVLTFLIRFLTPLLSTSMITKATLSQQSDSPSLHSTSLLGFSHVSYTIQWPEKCWELMFSANQWCWIIFLYVATSLSFWFDWILWKCCFALVQFRHLVRVSERSCFHLEYLVCGQKYGWRWQKISILLCCYF